MDALVTPSTVETLAAKNATKTISIVSLNLGDAVFRFLDHSVRSHQHIGRDRETDLLGGLEIDASFSICPRQFSGSSSRKEDNAVTAQIDRPILVLRVAVQKLEQKGRTIRGQRSEKFD